MANKLNFGLAFVTVVVLGISAGAMLGEQLTLVPYWQAMPAGDFYAWYADNAARLKGFFSPLQITSAVLVLLTAIVCKLYRQPGTLWFGMSTLFGIAVLATFFLYFKEANANFIAATMTANELSAALVEWSSWQWGRIALGVAAFCAALYGIAKGSLGSGPR